MGGYLPPSPAFIVAFLFAIASLSVFPEVAFATSMHASVTRHYKFDVRTKLFVLADFMHILAFSFGSDLSHNLRKNENHAYFKLNLLID